VRFLLELAWRELRVNGRSLWVFCACLMLGVILVAAGGGLYRVVSSGLLADTRVLLGGDLEIDSNAPLPSTALEWIGERGDLSLVIELDTMLGTPDGNFLRVELQSVDSSYPLYGELVLAPAMPLEQAVAFEADRFGAAVDATLAERLGIDIGDTVYVGDLVLQVRTIVVSQPDRRLSADWRGAPLLLSEAALRTTGLLQPGSRIEYEYHVRTDLPAETWRDRFYAAFPGKPWEIMTFADRSQRIAERLNQIASSLLIIGLSTLFIGGLGVFNSIETYLRGRLRTIAILRAVGLRQRPLAGIYLLQVGILSGGASLAGALLGAVFALVGSSVIESQIPLEVTAIDLALPAMIAFGFGILTAFSFTFPAIGRALSAKPAALFRGNEPGIGQLPWHWWLASLACAGCLLLMILLTLPDPLFGLGFVGVVGLLLLLLEGVVRGIRIAARALEARTGIVRSFAIRFALANLHRPGASLRTSLLSLGSAVTLLVACTLIVAALLRAINTTIPDEAPALVLYDVLGNQATAVSEAIKEAAPTARVELAPLVRARFIEVNGQPVAERADTDEARMDNLAARADYKLSYRGKNIDNVTLVAGDWWSEPVGSRPRMAMEDREVGRLGVALGDVITISAAGRTLEVEIAAIYSQKGLQTRFWFEGLLSDGALDDMISRQVGAAYLDDDAAVDAQKGIAMVAPNVISVRTAELLEAARGILGKASSGLAVIAAISLGASLLVLISVLAAGRTRQIYDATVLHAIGARLSLIRQGLRLEYLLLAAIASTFAILLGAAIALPLLRYRLKLPSEDLLWLGALVAFAVSGVSLALGARYLLHRLHFNPVTLLRGGQ
jgi:putative ABC transport system permease protein